MGVCIGACIDICIEVCIGVCIGGVKHAPFHELLTRHIGKQPDGSCCAYVYIYVCQVTEKFLEGL